MYSKYSKHSKYQPQLTRWFQDLPKGQWSDCDPNDDDSLIYINETHCVLSRLNGGKRFLLSFAWILFIILLSVDIYFVFVSLYMSEESVGMKFVMFFAQIALIIAFMRVMPRFFIVLFSPKHSPIVFNRKTNKVYVNESEFFSLKTRLTPFYLFYPSKKRIQEFDWDDLHCSFVLQKNKLHSLISIVLMACHPNTFDVKTHIVLHYCHSSSGTYSDVVRWGWVSNYMSNITEDDERWGQHYESSEKCIDVPAFNWEDYTKKNKYYEISDYNWPAWMIEAFDAQSLDELAEIKKKHGVEE